MPVRSASRARSAAPRLILLAGLALAFHCADKSPAYTVKGSWQGEPSTLKSTVRGDFNTMLQGLEPNVNLPPIVYHSKGIALSVEDGRLIADYQTQLDVDTTLNFRVNEEKAWNASLKDQNSWLSVRGQGADLGHVFWEASQDSTVKDVGDVKVEFNSDKAYNMTVARMFPSLIAGVDFGAKVRATNAGITGLLQAQRQLSKGVEVFYSVENPVGVYELGSSTHFGRISAPVAGGVAALRAEGNAKAQDYEGSYTHRVQDALADLKVYQRDGALGYNVSLTHDFDDLPVDAGVHVGVDENGVYGQLTAGRYLGNGIDAEYEARARYELGENHEKKHLRHALKLSNKLGYAQLVHGSGQAPKLRVGYEFQA